MAADRQPDWLSCLPPSWSYGVTRDGRIFFSEVNMTRGRGSAEPRCSLSRRILLSLSFSDFSFHLSPVFFHQQRRSEEQHLVASRDWRGCGHRAQENSRFADRMGGRIHVRGGALLHQVSSNVERGMRRC
ncbi:unnamed protein product [Tetraodon nigroviridis]|uniref:(spotted green pufferfish) hypothetical protein n=1 Tax=Tetraodon nigroviridis TaxID=99883 RepID=Q4SRG9_TETNG|nr:unnamed protein product [Tetraodon nigroviridis]